MTESEKNKLIKAVSAILNVKDLELKNCALESLLDMLNTWEVRIEKKQR